MRESVRLFPGGWVLWSPANLAIDAWVRFGMADNRLRALEIYLAAGGPIGARDLRQLQLGSLEAWVNGPELRDNVIAWMDLAYPDINNILHGMQMRRGPTIPERRAKVFPRVKIPSERRYPDRFYEAVAKLYSRLVEEGRPPVRALAEANEVPETTVNNWIREARRRGFLAPARRGVRG